MPITVAYDTEKGFRAALLSGSKAAFDRLYRAYSPQLLGYILKVVPREKTAEEVLQKTFVEIWDKRHEYLASDQSLFIWMLQITKKAAILYVTEEHNNEIRDSSSFVYIQNLLNKKQEHDPEKLQKAFFELLHYNHCSIKELAGLLNIDECKIKTMLRSAVANLKKPAL